MRGRGPPRPNPDAMRIRLERIAAMQQESRSTIGDAAANDDGELSSIEAPSSSSSAISVPFDENALLCSFVPYENVPSTTTHLPFPHHMQTRPNKTPKIQDPEAPAPFPLSLENCQHCGRTFVKEKMHVHLRRCTASAPLFGDKTPLQRRVRKPRSPAKDDVGDHEVEREESTVAETLMLPDQSAKSGEDNAQPIDPVALMESFYRKREQERRVKER